MPQHPIGSIEDQEWKSLGRAPDDQPDPRDDLLSYLKGEFQKGEPYQVVTREQTQVGLRISSRMVSRMEVLSAISRLPRDPRRVMDKLYVEDLTIEKTADDLNISEATVKRRRDAAIEGMVAMIYDWKR